MRIEAEFDLQTGTAIEADFVVASAIPVAEANHNDLAGRSSDDAHPISAITGLQDALDELETAIEDETEAREGADTTLQQNITAEASTRAAADTTLTNNLNTEIATRENADGVLATSISTETTAIKNATNFTATGKSTLAGLAMPSNTWIDISSHTFGTDYLAPANGYVYIQRGGTGNLGVSVSSDGTDANIVYMQCVTDNAFSGNGKAVAAPVRKGQHYKFWGTMAGTIFAWKFTYAEGEI